MTSLTSGGVSVAMETIRKVAPRLTLEHFIIAHTFALEIGLCFNTEAKTLTQQEKLFDVERSKSACLKATFIGLVMVLQKAE